MAVITINGREFPAPDIGGNLVVATNVSDGKNALGEFVGQRVGRDQYKFDSLQWKFLDAATWAASRASFVPRSIRDQERLEMPSGAVS